MSTIADFNRVEDCDKIDARCIDAYSDLNIDGTTICAETSWGKNCIDISDAIMSKETVTHMYLSPEDNPNCLVYEPEKGDNDCIHGDDLSRIISMTKLKDVAQDLTILNGNVYMFNSATSKFEPFDLTSTISNINTTLQNINAAITNLTNRVTNLETTIANHETRLQTIEALLVKPTGAPNDATIAWGTINVYSDTNAVVNSSGTATSLDKTHGIYTHNVNNSAYGDELFG